MAASPSHSEREVLRKAAHLLQCRGCSDLRCAVAAATAHPSRLHGKGCERCREQERGCSRCRGREGREGRAREQAEEGRGLKESGVSKEGPK